MENLKRLFNKLSWCHYFDSAWTMAWPCLNRNNSKHEADSLVAVKDVGIAKVMKTLRIRRNEYILPHINN